MNKGYNFNDVNNAQHLMQARLGIFEKKPFQGESDIEGINSQAKQLRTAGGYRQQERMIRDKRKTLDRAVHFSYQAAEVRKIDADSPQPVRALINPNKLKQDYDDKIISVGYEYGYKPGDVFEWLGTKTHWLIYLQDLTELAYFRGDIRKCNYWVNWVDEEGRPQSTWLAIRGPVETKINYIQKSGDSIDNPNYSLNILMPKTEATIKRFKRYDKFYLQNADSTTEHTCWRVEATDAVSMPGVLELNAVEYYSNEHVDDLETGMVGGLVPRPIEPEPQSELITGETFIKPKISYTYTYTGEGEGQWGVEGKVPVEPIEIDGNTITLQWTSANHGQFVLKHSANKEARKTIVVESLF